MEKIEEPKTLTQMEVDALLSSAERSAGAGGQAFSFKTYKPDLLSADKLIRLRTKHETLIHSFNTNLSSFLRKDLSLQISKLEIITHDKLIEMMPDGTHLTLFHLDPLPGTGIMEITRQLGLAVVSRMLGSQGGAVKADRLFTAIELRLMGRFAEAVLRDYAAMWRNYEPQLTMGIMGYENSAHFLKFSHDNSLLVFLAMDVVFGETTGNIRFAVPYSTLEPLIQKLITELLSTVPSGAQQERQVSSLQIPEPLMDVPIPIRAFWEGLQLTVEKLRHLRKDDVLVLDPTVSTRTALYMGSSLKYFGQVGRKADQRAVRITSEA